MNDEQRLAYIDEILGDVEKGICSPAIALIRISVWVSPEIEILVKNGWLDDFLKKCRLLDYGDINRVNYE